MGKIPIIIIGVLIVLGGGFFAVKSLSVGGDDKSAPPETENYTVFPTSEGYNTEIPNQNSSEDTPKYSPPNGNGDYFDPDEPYTADELYDNTAPAFSDVREEDGLAETNQAQDERVELREEITQEQALPQPVEETLIITEAKVENEERTVSKYLDLIIIKGTSGPRKDEVEDENIVLSANSRNESSINITNWVFRSAVTGRNIKIERAERLFISGSAGVKEDVVIHPGGKVAFLTDRSPIGSSFIVNICSGYLRQFQDFTPSIPNKCPVSEVEILYYDGDSSIFIDNDCMNYVEDIKKCKIVDEPFPPEVSVQCQEAIVENIGYNICVNRYRNEPDFWLDDQRIYLKRTSEIWRNEREIIELIDEEGFVVDFIEY